MTKNLLFFLIALLLIIQSGECKSSGTPEVLISVKRNYAIPSTEKARLVFDWQELAKRLPSLMPSNLRVTDQHFGQNLSVQINDMNGDSKPDQVILEYTFLSNEPVFAFGIYSDGKGSLVSSTPVAVDDRFELNYLTRGKYSDGDARSWAQQIVESTLNAYPNPKDLSIISPGKWTYEYGFFLNATYQCWLQTKDERYLNYIRQWVDNFITADGKFKEEAYHQEEYRLDDILPGRLCIWLYQLTGEEKYKKIVDQFVHQLTQQPKTREGGYWHKEIYPNQMWLDGIYMGDIFSVQYASAFKDPHWYDEATLQIKLMYQHAWDPATGLMYHGWDESINKIWAHPQKGTSPEFWSRAIGWYAMALVECLDYLPNDHPERKKIESMFQKLCGSIIKYQDKESGLWFQIIDKGNRSDNWIETSGSAMFTYAFAKGVHKGLLDKSFEAASIKSYTSLVNNYLYSDGLGNIHLDQSVKVGSLNFKNSKGDYAYYISCERRLDDYKGLAALLYASVELRK